MLKWDQHERNLAAETINRFVYAKPVPGCMRSTATRILATTCFTDGGRVTFLDFGLTKRFTDRTWHPWSKLCVAW